MTRDELIKRVEREMALAWKNSLNSDWPDKARAAINIVLEEAERIARLCHQDRPDYPTTSDEWADGNNYACEEIARQIRALKSGDGE